MEEGAHTFRFAHLSVREFLETKPEYCSEECNNFAAEVCLLKLIGACGSPYADRFLGQLGLSVNAPATLSETDSYKENIYNYALRNWAEHCVHAGEEKRADDTSRLSQLLRYFLFDDSGPNCPLNCWVRSRQRQKMESVESGHMLKLLRNYHRSQDRGFLLSCVFGFSEILRMDQYHDLDVDVKEQCIIATAIHGHYDILQFLIGETKDQMLQKRVLNALVQNNDIEPLRWFLSLVEPSLITERVIVRARRADREIFDLLLDHNKDLQITSELIEKCGWFYGAIEGLLSRAPDVAITPQILVNAIGPIEMETLQDILDRNGPSIITCDAIAMLGYLGDGEENMRPKMELLLKRAGPIRVTEAAMAMALEQNPSWEMVKMLLDHGWPVTQNILQRTAEWGMAAPFKLLLEAGGKLTPEMIAGSAKNIYDGNAMVKLVVSLMDRPLDDDLWAQMMLQCAENTWGNPKTLQALLEMRPGLKVPERNLLAFTKNSMKGNIILDIIFEDGREMEITDAVIENALMFLDYDETIPRLLDRHRLTEISNQLLLGAVKNRRFGDEMTKLLLDRYTAVEMPSPEVIEAVLRNDHSSYEIIQLLEAQFGHREFNETDVHIAAGTDNLKTLRLVLDRCSITEVTPSLLLQAASRGSLAVMKHLLTLNRPVISKGILIEASGNTQCTTDMLKLLWKLAPQVEVCPEMFINAADRHYRESTDLEFLFARVEDAKKCQEILNAVMSTTKINKDSGYVAILDLILESGFEIEVTNELIMSAYNARHGSVLQTFLEHKVDIKLSQEMVNKALELEDHDALKVLVKYGNPQELDLQDAVAVIDKLLLH
ncbi:hypothetical protein BDV36DRAFT_261153 [Aspergillus pseudocaelatus]|uniref:Ankyrin repeat-containing domain protein n=1 Tax=Aspergillus pseudocaelatus TaxID=1825620 RepID=A0ABQ6WG97_9EURO|nr:hypothetical protein BDV36DRAFT_261153 [Aspergillus pseudocaelatus]